MVLKREQRGPARLLTFDRPAARNAISRELAERLRDEIRAVDEDEQVHAVVLASSCPDVFASGGDLKELRQLAMDAGGASQVLALGVELGALETCAVPVIAAVGGAVFGGGCELLMMCDQLVMERQASLRFVHARMGLTPAWGGTTRLIERVGSARAADILLSARTIEAAEALTMGLACEVVEPGQALEAALALAERLSQLPRDALCAIKRSVLASKQARRAEAFEAERKVFRSAWGSPAHRAAFAALAGKPTQPS
ncbi:MAG: enoyl-CoA hydratase/isomerase family protein [Deltaproteobacteria bacterium]|nr:enoyl-CoA hydratase/isomerase family protein [Deltaproteobacteria bacterium]